MGLSTEKMIIQGAKFSVGTFEGTPYDYTELYVQESLDPSVFVGSATVPMKYGTSENFHSQLKGQQFPLRADVDVMTVTNGRGASKRVVTAVRIIKSAA